MKKSSKLHESVEYRPLVKSTLQRDRAQTCRKKSQTCITNQSHVEIQTSNATTKTPTSNCGYRQLEKTYSSSSNDGNNDCMHKNINKSNLTEWYIVLASNCYRSGFQSHVNHLDECSKNFGELQKKPTQTVFLRLPLSALFFRSPSLVVCSSPKSIKSASLCDKSNLFSDKIKSQCHPNQLNRGENYPSYCKKYSAPSYVSSQQFNSIDVHTKLSISDTVPITRPTIKEQFNVFVC